MHYFPEDTDEETHRGAVRAQQIIKEKWYHKRENE